MSRDKAAVIDCPEKSNVISSICYGGVSLVVAPYLLSFFGLGFELDRNMQSWVQFAYYTINCLVMVFIFKDYLLDTFFYIQMELRQFIARVADGAVLILLVSAVIYGIGHKMGNPLVMQGIIPTTEVELFALPSVLMEQEPVWAVLCLVIMTPVTTSLLYYATGFASTYNKSALRAYIQMALILAIPNIVNGLTFWPMEEEIILYAVQLPVHLLACRTYQKADSIWAPIATHMIVNLIACVVWLLGT